MIFRKMVLPLMAAGMLLSYCGTTKNVAQKKNVPQKGINGSVEKSDTTKKVLNKPKAYKDIITSKAITDSGLFVVHKIDDRYLFEIPAAVMNKDILIVSRISKAAANNRPERGFLGYAGDQINNSQVQFVKGINNKVFLKSISYNERSSDTSENGMYLSVYNSNVQPIIATFDIKAYTPDSLNVVIDMTDYINSDNNVFFFSPAAKRLFKLGTAQTDKSYIQTVESFPLNLEIKSVKTYAMNDAFFTYELNSSIVLLPERPMTGRRFDRRIGYFIIGYDNFDAPKGVEGEKLITRWRLEPKEEDIERYLSGELVEPKKSIVYYIDPSTPKKWVPYLIQGVNAWQKAFEKAGFKNAIYALEAPVNDPGWSLYDARHSAIVYKPSEVPNASGPHVHDPRSGEILETHINWYHNIISLLHDWYFVQASPNDPMARKMKFDDSLMGKLIQYVATHEVGHTLGLMHNFGSSSTIPVEKLRDKNWVEENGFCPSIMDYARFNYIAQPEDDISEKGILPRIGVYDEWAIEWGYRWFPEFKSDEEEKHYMDQWIVNKTSSDKRLWFGLETLKNDPRIQSEAVGDNAMKAGYYGIKNLKLVMSRLVEWTKTSNGNYDNLKKLRSEIIDQYRRYLFHVSTYIGGVEWSVKSSEEKGRQLQFTSRALQKSAVQFLQEQLFATPEWIMNKDVFYLVGGGGVNDPIRLQKEILEDIMTHGTFLRLLWFESSTQSAEEAYSFNELLSDLKTGIWKEIKDKRSINLYRRNLQKIYVERLIKLLHYNSNLDMASSANIFTDAFSVIKAHIRSLVVEIDNGLQSYKDEIVKWHLIDMRDRLRKALEEDKKNTFDPAGIVKSPTGYLFKQLDLQPITGGSCYKEFIPCWDWK